MYEELKRLGLGAMVLAAVVMGCSGTVPGVGGDDGGGGGDAALDGAAPDTGGARVCTRSEDCDPGQECSGPDGCGIPWTCGPALGRPCTDDIAPYCGCDGQTFYGSSSCPPRPFAFRGACATPSDAGPDALWYFHALNRYLETTGDRTTLEQLLPTLYDIVDHHVRGTHYGIHVDPDDGLLSQGADGYQLTWMDAKVADWVVTPRRGKAVEINALWYNALRLMQRWTRETGDDVASQATAARADQAANSFNRRFWYADGGYLYDGVDGGQGDDTALRPNQLLAISLDHPILEQSRWVQVLEKVKQTLLTPVGLRSLAPGHPDYKATYDGDLRCRDAAYHQGTVWGWLIGPYVDALLRVYPHQRAEARQTLDGLYRQGPLERVVIRRESVQWCESRAKLVRANFTQAIETHWRKRAIEWNRVDFSTNAQR